MGIKNMFKKKEPTEEEIVADMQRVGISTKSTNGRQEKFGAFKQYAQERSEQRSALAPSNPYAQMNQAANGSNPYGGNPNEEKGQTQDNPYARQNTGDNRAQRDPYARQAGDRDPYARQNTGERSDPYARQNTGERSDPYARSTGGRDPYSRQNTAERRRDPYASTRDDESTLDLNDIPSVQNPVRNKKPIRRPADDNLDLNDLPEEDLNVEVDDFYEGQEQVDSEEEEVEAIKQDIRFTKQESLASTRNTLRMAQEADASGANTLGMLGSQSERLYNAEQNLLLADTQTKIADEKVKELGRLNRSIFVPATGNPFNKKSRLRQQEQKLKADKMQEKYLRDTNRSGMYASEQRVKEGITNHSANSDLHNKYQGQKHLEQAKRYQIEADSEDDEMEKELASNLDQIANFSKKLKHTANLMGQEVDAQNDRLKKIEEDADRLDINVHLNSSRLNNIR